MKQLMIATILVGAMTASVATLGEDAYIESDGTQGLITGYCVTTNSRVELDFQLVDIADQYRLFSSGQGNIGSNTNNLQCDCYIGDSGRLFSIYYTKANGTQKGHNFHAVDTNRHVIAMDFSASSNHFQIWTNGQMEKGYTCQSPFLDNGRSTVPIALFCKNYNEYAMSFGRYAKAKIYGFKAYEAGSLVMNLVPWVKGGMAGLKDTCTGRFHSIESTRSCKVGGNVPEEKDDPYISSIINTNGIYVSNNRVAGKSICLDTGYTITPNTRVELDYASLAQDWASDNLYKADPWILGAYNVDGNSVTQQMYVAVRGNNKSYGYYCWKIGSAGQVNVSGLPFARAYGVRRTLSLDNSTIRLITAGYTNYVSTVAAGNEITSNLSDYTLKIGASYSAKDRYMPMRIYGLKFYESDVLMKDYKPFITNSVAGLTNSLDATDTLYSYTYLGTRTDGDLHATNVVFEAGGDITDNEAEKETYLQFDGVNGHRIDTGYIITKDSCIDIDFSLWSTTYNGQQMFLEQRGYRTTADGGPNGIWARLYINSAYGYSFVLRDYQATYTSTGVNVSNDRTQFKLDAQNGKVTVMRGGEILSEKNAGGTRTWMTCTETLKIGSTWNGGNGTCMQLYSFKISEAGALVRHYVPCTHEGAAGLYDLVTGEFFALTGGRVCGKGYKGQSERGTFEVALPQTAKITKGTGSYELSCIAPGASSFEWYENGKLIEGATTDSYTVEWTHKAPHMRTYKVVPIYSVFNEKVRGEAAETQVELTPVGIVIKVQ